MLSVGWISNDITGKSGVLSGLAKMILCSIRSCWGPVKLGRAYLVLAYMLDFQRVEYEASLHVALLRMVIGEAK